MTSQPLFSQDECYNHSLSLKITGFFFSIVLVPYLSECRKKPNGILHG